MSTPSSDDNNNNNGGGISPSRAKKLLAKWKAVAISNTNIYTMGFVSSAALLSDGKKKKPSTEAFLLLLTLVALSIQTVTPVAIATSLSDPAAGVCPMTADPLGKFLGFILCLYFVVLTVTLCQTKLTGMGFLCLFCSSSAPLVELLGHYRFYLHLGILANMFAMTAVGVTQFLLFIRNANRDYLLLVLQSLAMQFVLNPDKQLMNGSCTASTKQRLEKIIAKHEEEEEEKKSANVKEAHYDIETDGSNDAGPVIDRDIIKKVRFMQVAETAFLSVAVTVGIGWSIALAICM